jgi:hypothetical protein
MTDYSTLLRDRVTLKCRCIDRVFFQAYVPKLQSVGQVCIFLRWRKKFKIPSSAAFGKLGDAFVKSIRQYARSNGIPVIAFKKGENKEKIARPYFEAAAQEGKPLPGEAGKPKDSRIRSTRIWNGEGRWSMSITSISIFGTRNVGPLSGRPTHTHPIQSGCI